MKRSTLLLAVLLTTACGDDPAQSESDADVTADAVLDSSADADVTTDAVLDSSPDADATSDADATPISFPDYFDGLASATTVPCTLQNGTSTTCWRLRFQDPYPDETGPFCPETTSDIGGLGMYDGDTNPGLRLMDADLWADMEADGYDIVDDAGNVRISDPSVMGGGGMGSSCLHASSTPTVDLIYTIPVEPVFLGVADDLDTVEQVGVRLDGTVMMSDPPSATSGGPPGPGPGPGPGGSLARIPSIDWCGGHPDPVGGYYHAHFVSESIELVFDAHGIDEASCTRIAQRDTGLIGFAKDGYPIYGPHDPDTGAVPLGLDACNGRFGPTDEFPAGIYHYYALETAAPNMIPCLMGASIRDMMTYE